MTNAVVVYDNNDLELGDFFCSCVDSLDELFEKSGINPIKLGSSEVNTSNLCSYISPINEQKFFFSHPDFRLPHAIPDDHLPSP